MTDLNKIKYWDKLNEWIGKFYESEDDDGNEIPPEKEGDLMDIGLVAIDLTGFSGIGRDSVIKKYFK